MNNLKTLTKSLILSCISFLALCIPQFTQAQNVGIGTTTPNSAAALDVVATNKGILIPRVALVNTTAPEPIPLVNGMIVYNTNTGSDVTPGFYVCIEGKWQKAGGGWSLTGNSSTNPATNFIGTSDNQDVIFKRSNIRAGLLNSIANKTSFGVNALHPNNTGNGNTAIGAGALETNGISSENTAVGNMALKNNTTGSNNTAIGSNVLLQNTTGNGNIGIGFYALEQNKAGNNGIAIGNNAMEYAYNSTTVFTNRNIAIGAYAMRGSTTSANNLGNDNNAIGYEALNNNTSGRRNISLGTQTLFNNTTGSGNVAIGPRSLYNNSTKSDNTAIGDSTLFKNGIGAALADDGTFNTAIGARAMRDNTTGNSGTAVGFRALMKNSTGTNNTGVGSGALQNNTTAVNNTAIGTRALQAYNGSGFNNVAVGVDAMKNKTSGNNNVALGTGSMSSNLAGSFNTSIGVDAGAGSTGSDNVFLGYAAGQNETGSNRLYIHNGNADANNALIYGEFDGNKRLRINGRTEAVYNITNDDTPALYGENDNSDFYGIGVRGKGGWKGVEGIVAGTGSSAYYGVYGSSTSTNTGGNFGVYGVAKNGLENYAGYFDGVVAIGDNTPTKAAGYLLSVDGKIACTEVRVQPTAEWPDYVFSQEYNLIPLCELEKSINEQKHLPGIPSAMEIENDGIQVGEMQRKMMEKIEELTLYIIDLNKKIESLQSENNTQAEQLKKLSKE